MGAYRDELTRAMTYLGGLNDSVFLGQAVAVPGTAMFGTLESVPRDKRIELPVEEDFQLGMSLGLGMQGALVISIFPRWNFLLLAINQLVNHLDKFQVMSNGRAPRVLIRTSIGSERPLDPGPQHTGDFTFGVMALCPALRFVRLDEANQIYPEYRMAVERSDGTSTVLIEWGDYYSEK